MVDALLELVVAPALVGAATLAARRWGERVGGVVSAFPAIVGPVLLIAALHHGTAFAGRAASGTLLGLVALSGFAGAYGRDRGRAAPGCPVLGPAAPHGADRAPRRGAHRRGGPAGPGGGRDARRAAGARVGAGGVHPRPVRPGPLADLLRGMLAGMAGFVAFCALVAVLAEPAGIAAAFTIATAAALAVQVATARAGSGRRDAAAATAQA